jgi:hypothetical protein
MNTPQQPKAPDPTQTANAQAAMNRDSAVATNLVNMTNQVTPDGSLTYEQTGTKSYVGSDGKTYTLPSYTARQTLSAPSQAIYDTNKVTEQNIANIGRDQSARVGEALSKPVNLSNEATEARLFGLGSKRLDPLYARREEELRTRLTNQGIRPGTEAWNWEMQRLGEDRNDAFNQLLLSGRGQSVTEALAERNQPINEITALMSGSQVSQPNFVGTPQTSIAPGDYQGAVANKYAADMNAYNSQVSQRNATMGGLFGLASSPFQMFRFGSRA